MLRGTKEAELDMLLVVHVDDLIMVASTCKEAMKDLNEAFATNFSIKYLGEVKYYFSIISYMGCHTYTTEHKSEEAKIRL